MCCVCMHVAVRDEKDGEGTTCALVIISAWAHIFCKIANTFFIFIKLELLC